MRSLTDAKALLAFRVAEIAKAVHEENNATRAQRLDLRAACRARSNGKGGARSEHDGPRTIGDRAPPSSCRLVAYSVMKTQVPWLRRSAKTPCHGAGSVGVDH